uniref:NB-ARC domain-containing protein n=1 Tax=Daucus carota subsp. sativus TaxID=79200 RepID=A0A166IAH0_DAUCS
MVDAIVSTAIEKLSDFLTQEINIRIGVKDGVHWLKDELVYLQSSARYAESRQHEELIRIWINNVNEVAQEAVIILERFSDHQKKHSAPRQGVLDCLRSSICICTKEVELYDIGKEIESVKGRVNEIKNRRAEYGIGNILDTANVQQRKRALLRATAVENKVDVVGFEDDVRILLAELTEDPALKYVSIHGMGGLGKTTLAGKLYHSSELSHLKSRAWVCVSEDYKTEDVLRKIIKSFMKQKLDGELAYLDKMDEADLLQHLLNLLQERDGFLAVIDDIWDIKVWKKIKSAFPDKRDGSGVIITTRYKKVAERVDDRCVVHKLRFLNEEESWQLLCKTAKQTPNLDKLGREMVSRCRGLPLAIVALGGLLFHKKSYQDWSKVKNDLWRQLKGESAEIDEILSLSYNELSPQMRDCFLYLARFPEDYTFGVEKLKLLWIAEEFITDKGDGLVMEDVAEEYVNELINRNMILIATFKFDGQVAKCQVHDVVRDLAIQKASADKFLGVFDSSKKHPNPIRGHRRQAIYNGTGDYLELPGSCSDDLKVCSLSVMNESEELTIEEVKLIYTRFENLIVLDLADFSRYKFPREICELEDLRHIRFHKGGFKIQSNQTKLQTVDTIKYSDWIQIDTVNLLDLRALSITSVEGEEVSEEGTAYSWESIAKLTSLETFNFYFSHYLMIPSIRPLSYCENLQSVCLSGPIKDPSELRFLPESVTNLSLSKTKFTQDPMPTLASLSNITALDLGEGTYTGEKMVCSDNTFPCLQFLKLVGHPNLKEWHVEDGAMPSLRGLYIDDCDNMMIPERLNCVPPTPDFTELIYEKKKREIVAQHARELLEGYLMRSPTGEVIYSIQ